MVKKTFKFIAEKLHKFLFFCLTPLEAFAKMYVV